MKKQLLLYSLAFFSLVSFVSCDKDVTVTSQYVYEFTDFYSDVDNDLKTVTSYLKEKGIVLDEVFSISGDSHYANNDVAVAGFDSAIAKVSETEISELGLSTSASFILTLTGTGTDQNWDEPLASYTYPEE